MNAVCGEGCKTYGVEPEEELVVDDLGLLGEVLLTLMFPVNEYKSDVGSNRCDDYEKRIFEGRGRSASRDEISDDAAACCCQKGENVDTEDIHLLSDTCHGTGHCKSDSADDIHYQHEKFCIHSSHYICFRGKMPFFYYYNI